MPTNIKFNPRTRVAAVTLIALLLIVVSLPTSSAEETVDLGTADPFAILAGSAVTNTGPSVINGDIGVHPGTSVTGFETATVNGDIHSADAVAEQAKVDLTTAYNDAAERPDATSLATELGDQELIPGVYDSESGTFGLTGSLTLDAEGDPAAVWIFQMESTLITATDSSVDLINGAQACNLFWQVGSSATLGTRTDFKGNIMAEASITMNNGATLEGRALARTEAVTLDDNVITIAECALEEEPPEEEPPGEDPPGEETPGEEQPMACSTGLMASANEDTSITLTWNHIEGAEQYRIYRAVDDGAFVLHGEVDGDTTIFNDTDTKAGVTYGYEVRPVIAGVESGDCDRVEVTAIPFFTGLLTAAPAVLGGVAAYALGRRRT